MGGEHLVWGLQNCSLQSEAVVLCQKTTDCSLQVGCELLPQTEGLQVSCSGMRVKWREVVLQVDWCGISSNVGRCEAFFYTIYVPTLTPLVMSFG